jgi:hypothetical protein
MAGSLRVLGLKCTTMPLTWSAAFVFLKYQSARESRGHFSGICGADPNSFAERRITRTKRLKNIPQWLKPRSFCRLIGTNKFVPLQNMAGPRKHGRTEKTWPHRENVAGPRKHGRTEKAWPDRESVAGPRKRGRIEHFHGARKLRRYAIIPTPMGS